MNYFFLKKIYQKKYFGDNPYLEGGKKFQLKIFLFAFFAYLLGIFGIFLSKNLWEKFSNIFSVKLNFVTNLLILSVGGFIFILISYILVYYFGPVNLKRLLVKIRKKILK